MGKQITNKDWVIHGEDIQYLFKVDGVNEQLPVESVVNKVLNMMVRRFAGLCGC